jgi:hypothetical protein
MEEPSVPRETPSPDLDRPLREWSQPRLTPLGVGETDGFAKFTASQELGASFYSGGSTS